MIVDSEGIRIYTDQIILLLLFLFAIDFADMSGILIALILIVFFFLRAPELRFDRSAGILILFSCFYFGSVAFYEGLTVDTVIKFALAPWGNYVLAYTLRLRNRDISVTDFSTLIAFGFFLHGMLNLFAGIRVFGANLNNNFRLAYDFWQGRTISVTTASLYYTPFTMMSIGLIFFSKRKAIKLLSVVSVALALYASMIYQNRTLILACALVLSLNVLLVTIDRDIPFRKKRTVYIILASFVLAAAVAFLTNIGGLRDTIMNSSLMNRVSSGKQDRTTIWISFIFGEAWKYPFGGTKAVLYDNKPFVHNLWLDTFRRTGFFPFIFLILFTLLSALDTREFCRLGRLNGEDTSVFISLLGGMMLSFMVEPVIEANPYVFYLPLFVMGAVNGHNRDTNNLLENPLAWEP